MTGRDWDQSIFSVCQDGALTCLTAYCCGPCYLASARQRYDSSNWCFNLCCLSPCAVRNIIREGYGYDGTCLSDILWSGCCAPCSVCQLAHETKISGEKLVSFFIYNFFSKRKLVCVQSIFCTCIEFYTFPIRTCNKLFYFLIFHRPQQTQNTI